MIYVLQKAGSRFGDWVLDMHTFIIDTAAFARHTPDIGGKYKLCSDSILLTVR